MIRFSYNLRSVLQLFAIIILSVPFHLSLGEERINYIETKLTARTTEYLPLPLILDDSKIFNLIDEEGYRRGYLRSIDRRLTSANPWLRQPATDSERSLKLWSFLELSCRHCTRRVPLFLAHVQARGRGKYTSLCSISRLIRSMRPFSLFSTSRHNDRFSPFSLAWKWIQPIYLPKQIDSNRFSSRIGGTRRRSTV